MKRMGGLRVGEALTKSMNSSADLGGAILRVVDEKWRRKTVIGLKNELERAMSIELEVW